MQGDGPNPGSASTIARVGGTNVLVSTSGIYSVTDGARLAQRYSFLSATPEITIQRTGEGRLFPSAYSGFYAVDQWQHFDSNLNVIASARPDQIGNKTLSAISSDETRLMAFEGRAPGPAPVVMDLDF
jgi:hypothetical protein